MRTVVVTIDTRAVSITEFPTGTVAAGIQITFPGYTPVTVAASPYTARFQGVPVGDYQVTAQAIDASGAPLGATVISDVFTVGDLAPTPGEVMVDVPLTITVTLE